jgi:hypothetical protein
MRPGQELHTYVFQRLEAMVDHSRRHAELRHDTYDNIEALYFQYADPAKTADDGSPTNPYPRSVVIPFSYAAAQTAIAHWHTAWTMHHPWMRLRSLNPAEDQSAEVLEGLLDANHTQDMTSVKLWGILLDAIKYGQGRIVSDWYTEHEQVYETFDPPLARMLGIPMPPVTRQVNRLVEEGTRSFIVDPRDWFPDPRAPGVDPQQGEFVAVRWRRSFTELWNGQQEGRYFNVHHLRKQVPPAQGQGAVESTPRDDIPGQAPRATDYPTGIPHMAVYEGFTIWAKVIPSYWRTPGGQPLGKGVSPEIWVFSVAWDSKTIIQAQPLQSRHRKFPVGVVNCQFEPHAAFPPSDMELMSGLQESADFLLNMRHAYLRLGLYQAIFFDPTAVETEDLERQQPGLRVRLRPERPQGVNLSESIMALSVPDQTGGVFRDLSFTGEMIEKALGTVDLIQGLPASGERSATEMGGVLQNAQTRVGARGSLMYNQGIVPWGTMEVKDTQQFMSDERWVRLSPRAAARMGMGKQEDPRMLVGPDRIRARDVYVVPCPPNAPVNRNAMGQLYMGLAMKVAESEQLMGIFDPIAMFREGARLSGARTIEEFVRRPQPQSQATIMDDDEVRNRVQAGNLVPTPGDNGDPVQQMLRAAGMPL